MCLLPVYRIEGQRIPQYRPDGSVERDAGHVVQYLQIRGCAELYIQPHCPYFNFPACLCLYHLERPQEVIDLIIEPETASRVQIFQSTYSCFQ